MARAEWPWRKPKIHPEREIDGHPAVLPKRARPPDIALETALQFAIIELCSILVMLDVFSPGLNIRLPLGTSTEGMPRRMRAASDLGAGGTSLVAM